MNVNALCAQLSMDEGRKYKIYVDTVGKRSLGVGRNLDDVGVSDDEIDLMLKNDVQRAVNLLNNNAPWWSQLTDARQQVMANMCFNMGWGDGTKGLSSFKNTLACIREGGYDRAADQMLLSVWAKQVGDRAARLANMMRKG
ncbi:MAG: lysozyme [Deltaproteobacteria bacterium 37-65-8]|nr:MAG: lysozyme [Deltaproteobacteria bacterium 37-65-8]